VSHDVKVIVNEPKVVVSSLVAVCEVDDDRVRVSMETRWDGCSKDGARHGGGVARDGPPLQKLTRPRGPTTAMEG